MGAGGRLDLLRRHAFEREEDVDAAENEHAFFHLYFAVRDRCQVAAARRNPARLQRASKGAEQSAARSRDDVIQRRRMRIGNLALDAVVPRDRAVRAEVHRLRLGGQLGTAKRSLDSRDRDARAVDDLTHESSYTSRARARSTREMATSEGPVRLGSFRTRRTPIHSKNCFAKA